MTSNSFEVHSENAPFAKSGTDFLSISASSAYHRRAKYNQPESHATWLTAAQLMIADIVGVGVLTLATAMSDLGWIMGIIFIILFFPVNMYTGLLLWQVRMMFPKAVTYMDMSRYSFRKRGKLMARISACFVYAHIFLVLGDYVLVVGQSLGLIFYDLRQCKPIWIAIGCICILPFNQIRLLNGTRLLCWVNMGTITAAVFLSLGYLMVEGMDVTLEHGSVKELVNSELTIWIFARAFSKIAFAYAGQFLYLEIMAEMKKPQDFPWTFAFSGPYQVVMYLLVGCIGYEYKGNGVEGMLIDNIGFNIWMRLAGLLLFVHMLITYLIKGNVMSRAIHLTFFRETVNDKGFWGSFIWFCITSCLLLFCFLVANAIPFFESLSGLIGALLVPIACWNLPVMYYIAAKSKKNLVIPNWEWPLLIFVFILGLLLTFTGTYANISDILEKWETAGYPFECHCDNLWNTCECSANHTGMSHCNVNASGY